MPRILQRRLRWSARLPSRQQRSTPRPGLRVRRRHQKRARQQRAESREQQAKLPHREVADGLRRPSVPSSRFSVRRGVLISGTGRCRCQRPRLCRRARSQACLQSRCMGAQVLVSVHSDSSSNSKPGSDDLDRTQCCTGGLQRMGEREKCFKGGCLS